MKKKHFDLDGILYQAKAALLMVILWLSFGLPNASANPNWKETTPSRSEYFTWINDTNEGSTESQTSTNLNFFKWLHDQYGMNLNIYAFDAGNIDTADAFGGYATMSGPRFQQAFPNGFTPLVNTAASFNAQLGLWMGADGFGTNSTTANARINLLTSLAGTYNMGLFKIDAVGGDVADANQYYLRDALAAVINLQPDMIILNHRSNLKAATPYGTTTLWQGDETYVDVKISNSTTAPHHRQGALNRGLPNGLTRLVEDHGVCLSSCMDGWDDDLIYSSFGRSLIVSPEIYGNPWLLKDSEFPKLARIYNLHERYGAILVNGKTLPSTYGPSAVSRGDSNTRFVVMKNMTWAPVTYNVQLTSEIGVSGSGTYQVRQLHPTEKIIGSYAGGSVVPVTVDPFRSCLLLVSSSSISEVGITGANYTVNQDTAGQPVIIKVIGQPGTSATIGLQPGNRSFTAATLNGTAVNQLVSGGTASVTFSGTALAQPITRSLGTLTSVSVPADAEALYEATCFAADNNSLEARSLARAGVTSISQVQAARNAFFNALRPANYVNGFGAPIISDYGMWDLYAFDNNNNTSFTTQRATQLISGGAFRIDFGSVVTMTQLRFNGEQDSLTNLNAQVSSDLSTWTTIAMTRSGSDLIMNVSGTTFRYFRIAGEIKKVTEIRAFNGATELSRTGWRASNLFGAYAAQVPTSAWSLSFTLPEAPAGSYFCVALEGTHGIEGAYAAARINGVPVGANDRAISFPTGMWETGPEKSATNYTYYIPIKPADAGKTVDLVVLGLPGGSTSFTPKAYITAPTPYSQSQDLVLTPAAGGGTTYALAVNSGKGDGNYTAGSIVNVAANTPPAGQVFSAWTGNTSALSNPAAAITTLTMPAAGAAITATYVPSGGGTYALTVNSGTGGGSYAAGTVVNVSANAAPAGQVFTGWTGATSALASASSSNTTLTMPAAATSITATYSAATTYALTVNSGTGGGNYAAGTLVTVTANAAPAGQVFSAWTGNTSGLGSTTSATTTMTMPASAASITATYVTSGGTGSDKIRFFPRAGYPDRMVGGVFEGTNGDPVTGTYTTLYTISTLPTASAWNETMLNLGTYRYLRYRAPASSWCNVAEIEFYRNGTKLTGTAYGTAGSFNNLGDTFSKVFDTNTSTFFDSNQAAGAYAGLDTGSSGPVTYALTVNNGMGGGSYAAGTAVTVTANTPPAGQVFSAWTGSTSALASTTSATTTLTMPAAAASITATYVTVPNTYALTVNSGTGSGNYTAGTVVTVTANMPPAGQVFSAWTGNTAGLASTTSANTTLTMPGSAASITATYVTSGGSDQIRYYPRSDYFSFPTRMVGGVFEGTNGDPVTGTYTVIHTITSQPTISAWTEVNVGLGSYRYLRYRAPASSWCSVAEIEFYRSGTKLTGTAYGTAGSFNNSGNTFAKVFDGITTTYFDSSQADGAYAGIDTGTSGGPTTYALTVTSGTGGGSYAAGTAVTVTANTPPGGQVFTGWTGATSALANPAAASTTLTMPAAAASITATYAPVTTYALTVTSGTGGGNYASGSVVTVTANTPPAGQVFSAWTGNTSGLASTTSASTTLTMPSAATSITATYVTTGSADKVRYYPRSDYYSFPARMVGGVFEGTNGDPVTGTYTVLYTITTQPAISTWTEVSVSLGNYRYLRYRGGVSSWGTVAEVEFYRGGTKLTGTSYGTPGSFNDSGNTFAKVFDGLTTTYFDSTQADGAYAGLDTGTGGGGTTTYALTVTSGTGGGSYTAGTAVTVTANTPPAGQVFAGWTGSTSALVNPALPTTTLNMPSAAASITATYAASGGLPSPWVASDIGAPTPSGSVSYNSGVYTVQGSGGDIWYGADSFNYVSRSLTGDGTIIAKVDSMTNTNGWAKAGVMMRSSLSDGASNVFAAVTPTNGFTFQTRAVNGDSTGNTGTSGITAPRWVKITRVGNVFTASHSADGTTWTTAGSSTVTMPSTIYIGLAVTSHASGTLCSAAFSNVSP